MEFRQMEQSCVLLPDADVPLVAMVRSRLCAAMLSQTVSARPQKKKVRHEDNFLAPLFDRARLT
jgi:hypothetical protein